MSERGPYRPIHTVLLDGPDFQVLSPDARLVLLVAKIALGPSGIDVLYTPVLEQRTGLAAKRLKIAIAELGNRKWLSVDGNVAWVVRGLEFEPTFRPSNAHHRQAVRKHLASLPRRPIVEAFRSHYGPWFADESVLENPSPSHANGIEIPSPGHLDALASTIDDRGETIKERGETRGTPAEGADEPSVATANGTSRRPTRRATARPSANNWIAPVLEVWRAQHGNLPDDRIRAKLMRGLSLVYRDGQTPEQMAERFGIWLASVSDPSKHQYVEDFTSRYGDYDPAKCASTEHVMGILR